MTTDTRAALPSSPPSGERMCRVAEMTIARLREQAKEAQKREGRPDATVRMMMARWWPTDQEDPERVQLFKHSGPWGDVGRRWMCNVMVRFRADEVLAALRGQGEGAANPERGGDGAP